MKRDDKIEAGYLRDGESGTVLGVEETRRGLVLSVHESGDAPAFKFVSPGEPTAGEIALGLAMLEPQMRGDGVARDPDAPETRARAEDFLAGLSPVNLAEAGLDPEKAAPSEVLALFEVASPKT